jgi:hypothetical protein
VEKFGILCIYEDVIAWKDEKKNKKEIPEGRRTHSKRFCDAIEYLINNEQSLRTFINNKNGVMHNNMTEQKFRPLDILRNSMLQIIIFRDQFFFFRQISFLL